MGYSGQMYYDINKLLLKLQFNVSSIGFHYWATSKATATEQIQKQFNYYNKLTNKTVLELLTRYALFIEKLDNHIPRID